MGKPTLFFPIDLDRAQEAPVAHYALRLMVATNDFVACRHLANAVDYYKSAEEQHHERNLKINSLMYIMRMQESHIVEVYDGLIHPVLDPQAHNRSRATSIQEYVYSMPRVKERFDSAAQLLAHPIFHKLRKVRNRIGFHYDVDGRIYKKALAIHSRELSARDREKIGHLQISRDKRNKNLLHLLGCEVLQTLWRQLLGNLPDIDDYSDDAPTQEVKQFITTANQNFLLFADAFLSEWVVENNLKGKSPIQIHDGTKTRMIWGY